MRNQYIGRIISIDYKEIIVETIGDIGDYICTDDGVRFIGELGSYITIDDIDRRTIAEITAVDEKDVTANKEYSRARNDKFLKLSPIGEICNQTFKFGITKMPSMFAEVRLISENDLQIVMNVLNSEESADNNNSKVVTLPIGSSVIFPEFDVKIKLNEFFGFHFAILGNTGSGKSNTLAQIIQKIFSKKNYSACGAKFIIFDSNDEYKDSFIDISKYNPDIKVKFLSTERDTDKFSIPVWALSVDDWAILLHASEKTQIPIISRALEIIKLFSNTDESQTSKDTRDHIIANVILAILSGPDSSSSKSDKIISVVNKYSAPSFKPATEIELIDSNTDAKNEAKISISDSVIVSYGQLAASASLIQYCQSHIKRDFNFTNPAFARAVKYSLVEFKDAIEFAIIYEGSVTSNKIFEYTSTLVTRIQHLIESEQGKILEKTEFDGISQYINSMIGNNQILNIDISNLDDTATEVVTKVFSKMLFDYVRKLSPRNCMPINLILEEAHRFIKNNEDYGVLGYNIFERIAKEGRKYGLHMGISSQRPSELSKTVVSQCSNFIIHRLQNPDDLHYVSSMVPFVNKNMIDRISYLPRGHALVFGTAINLPMLTSFEHANPAPNSSNSNITDKWYIADTKDC